MSINKPMAVRSPGQFVPSREFLSTGDGGDKHNSFLVHNSHVATDIKYFNYGGKTEMQCDIHTFPVLVVIT